MGDGKHERARPYLPACRIVGVNPYHREHSLGVGVGVGVGILKAEMRSSTQALEIEKAMDLVDERRENDDDGRGEGGRRG